MAYEREVRLGLVLYGGVSLAIYMNGIAQEFFRAARGCGLYGFIKLITNSEVVLDVISGTSAGGINGIFLAYALANGYEFGACSDLWREEARFSALLHQPFGKPTDSILDGEGYYRDKLTNAFQKMRNTTKKQVALKNDLDLFVTGTDFYGDVHTEFDEGGHPIDLMNHRVVFHLRHGANSEHDPRDFTPGEEREEALAKLAAITSCFPLAFAPVPVEHSDADLQRWGNLVKSKFFIDGGVLANKPFTPTIQAIFNHSVDREVDRHLCYVEPNPEIFREAPPATAPNAIRTVIDSLSTLPRYQDISADLKSVADHNSQVEQYLRLCKAAKGHIPEKKEIPENRNVAAEINPVYNKARLLKISNRVLKGIFRENGRDPRLEQDAKEIGSVMVNCFEDLVADKENARRISEYFDIYFRRRRLLHVMCWNYRRLYREEEKPGAARAVVAKIWEELNGFNKILEIIQGHMESLVDRYNFCWRTYFSRREEPKVSAAKLWAEAERVMRHLVCSNVAIPNPTNCPGTSKFDKQLEETRNAIIPRVPPHEPSGRSILAAYDEAERKFFENYKSSDASLWREYYDFENLDAVLFSAELISGLSSLDLIKTVRFSPQDANVGACSLKNKVLGTQFGSFGGFFKEQWRSNDIFFGRLDGVCQLTQMLLGENSLAHQKVALDSSEIVDRFFNPDGSYKPGMRSENFFPNCRANDIEDAFRAAIRGDWNSDVCDALIRAEHNEVFIEEYPHLKGMKSKEKAKDLLDRYGTLEEVLRRHYPILQETGWSLFKPTWLPRSVPVVLKAAGAVVLVGVGLLIKKRRGTRGQNLRKTDGPEHTVLMGDLNLRTSAAEVHK